MTMSPDEKHEPKIGQEYGDVRAPLPLDRLEPFLQQNVKGYAGPLEVKQFKVGDSNQMRSSMGLCEWRADV